MMFDSKRNLAVVKILEILSSSYSKSGMYSNLFREVRCSHSTLQSALRDLIDGRFIEKGGGYMVTEKGRELLQAYKRMANLINS